MGSFNVALLGAECTGKSTLADALFRRLKSDAQPVVQVPEYLREWCDTHGRTPLADEQAHIALVQSQRISQTAAALHQGSILIADTAPLMTAVYSEVYFGDVSLYPFALAHHRSYALTLLTGLDLPWLADGIQRNGEAMRNAVDRRLRDVLAHNAIAYSMVYGQGQVRAQGALQAIHCAMSGARAHPDSHANANASADASCKWQWSCEKCSDADCEHRMFSGLL